MVSSLISRNVQNDSVSIAHREAEGGSSTFILFDHTGFLETLLQPLSEKLLKPLY